MNTKTLVRTALMIALLVAVQAATASMGQMVTGSCVNLILAVSALMVGGWGAPAVALVSPFCAFLLGIGPALIQLVPCIALGNLCFVLALQVLVKRFSFTGCSIAAVVLAAAGKFAVLFLLIVKAVLPLLGLPEARVAAMSAMFSWPQLVTALIGGLLAVVVVAPLLKKAVKSA